MAYPVIPWPLKRYRVMRHAMTRGANGRRHEVDLPAAPVRVEIYSSEETIKIFTEANFEALLEERRRFAFATSTAACV
jgi:hypothetical protein